jgi:hypothetical protein
MLKNFLHRALTPALGTLMVMLGAVTVISVSQSQKKAEAFSCFQPCSNLNPCPSTGSCHFCDRNECLVS